MQATYDQIVSQLHAAAASNDNAGYIELLERVILEAKNLRLGALHKSFGAQFKKTAAVEESLVQEGDRTFSKDQKVITSNGYIGYVHGYDKKGKVVVNIVHMACEFDENDLQERGF